MRVKKATIMEYFDELADNVAKCKRCGICMKNERANNLRRHLEKIHAIVFTEENRAHPSSVVASSPSSIVKRASSKKDFVKVNISKKDLFKSYIGLVTENNIPFHVLNSVNFRSIFDPICDGLSAIHGKKFRLNASNCKSNVALVAQKIRDIMKCEMKYKPLSLKIDSASRLSRTIFGINVQYIQDEKVNSRLLGMLELKGATASTSKKLAAKILEVLNQYDISLQQIVSITSDNGANVIKAAKLLSDLPMSGVEHDAEEINEDYLKNINDFELFDESFLKINSLQHCRCAAHTCQLCALDLTKNNTIKNFLLQCRNLTKFIRKPSNGFRELFELKNLRVPGLDCATRWGSTYNMLEALKNARNVLENLESVSVTNKSDDENFEVNLPLWSFVDAYVKVCGPLYKIIVKFQEEDLNYGEFYACWLKCKLMTRKIVEKTAEEYIYKCIGEKLLESIEIREKKLLNNEAFNACLFLDLRFHHLLNAEKRQEAKLFLLKLWTQLQSINPELCKRDASNDSCGNENLLVIDDDDENNVLNNFLQQGVENSSQKEIDLQTKLEKFSPIFSGADADVLQYWKTRKHCDPELYTLAMTCFAIPPTQVSVERAFSALKLILSDLRVQLKPDLLQDILIVKLNKNFMDEAVNSLPLFEEDDENVE